MNPELHTLARRQRPGQCDFKHRAVFRIAVVGRDKLHLLGQVALSDNFQRLHLIRAEVLFLPALALGEVAIPHPLRLCHPGGFRLECIQIQMEGKPLQRGARVIGVGQHFGGVQRMRLGVVSSLDLVGHHAVAQRRALGSATGREQSRNCHQAYAPATDFHQFSWIAKPSKRFFKKMLHECFGSIISNRYPAYQFLR